MSLLVGRGPGEADEILHPAARILSCPPVQRAVAGRRRLREPPSRLCDRHHEVSTVSRTRSDAVGVPLPGSDLRDDSRPAPHGNALRRTAEVYGRPRTPLANPRLGAPLEKWLNILGLGERYAAGEPLPEELAEEEELLMAVNELKRINADAELRQLLELRAKEAHDRATALAEARERGIEEGIQKGIEKGIEKGAREE